MGKQKSNSESNIASDAGFAIIFGIGAIIAWAVIIFLALPASLANMGEKLRLHDYNEWEILKSKAWRIAGILPFVLVLAYYTADRLPKRLTFRSAIAFYKGSEKPTDEASFRAIAEDIKAKLEDAKSTASFKKSMIQSTIEDAAGIQREIKQAKTIEERSQQEERLRGNGEELANTKKDFTEAQDSIPGLEEKLKIARSDLEAFRNGRPTSFDHVGKQIDTAAMIQDRDINRAKFMWYGFLFTLLSLVLSYPMIYFTRSEKEIFKRLQYAARFLDYLVDKVSYLGLLPFRFLATVIGSVASNNDKAHKPSGVMQVGYERNAFLTDRNLNYHTQVIGGSGAGKTNLLKVMLEDRIAKGHAIIFFDFKGEVDLIDWMAGATGYYGRRDDLAMISMADPKTSYAYNPIGLGTETEISSQVMNAFTWSETFYKNSAENALLIILKAFCYQRDMTGDTFHLGDLYRFLTDPSFRMDMVSAVSQLNYPEMFRGDLQRICEELSTNKKENYLSLITQISKILNSSAGEIVAHKIGHDEEFNLKEAMSSGKITYFMMNNLKLKETASIMGKLILQDLMKTVGNIYDDRNYKRNPVTLIIDEFASFATPDFGEFIEKARGAGISIVVTYQSRKSLDHIEQSLALKMNENTANKIVFQVQDSEDVEWFCSLLGTKTTEKETYQTEVGLFGDTKTGAKSMREVEEYVIHPNEIKKLKLGQALLYCSKVDPHHVLMNIQRANEFTGRYERASAPIEQSVMPENINIPPVNQKNNNGVQYDDLV